MIRAVFKTETWYTPNENDMKVCADCRDGWAFMFDENFKMYVHRPNKVTAFTFCRAVNDLEKSRWSWLKSRMARVA